MDIVGQFLEQFERIVLVAFWLIVLSLVARLLKNYLQRRRYYKGKLLPPGPSGWPVIGNLLNLGRLPHHNIYALHRRFGPIIYLRLGSVRTVVIDDPDIIKEILKSKDHVFASRPKKIAVDRLAYGGGDVAMAPYGNHWKNGRRICMMELLTPKRLEGFRKERTEEAGHLVQSVWTDASKGEASDLKDALGALSMNVMTRMLLGKRYFGAGNARQGDAQDFKKITHEVFRLLGVFPIGDFLPFLRWLDLGGHEKKMIEVEKSMDAFHSSIVEEHRKKSKEVTDPNAATDFVDVLLSLPGENGEEHLSDQTVKALVQDMIAAGTDTSAVTNEWAMAEMIRHPDLLRKVQSEIDHVVGCERMVLESDLGKLKYLECVVKETFRMHPPGAFLIPHLAMEDSELGGYIIPKDTQVLISGWGLGRNPRLWEEVEEFKPERWMEDGGEKSTHDAERVDIRDTKMRIIPFSAGRRGCPGGSLGTTIVMLGLASLIHCFDWTPLLEKGATDIDMEESEGLTTPKLKPLLAFAKPRLPAHLYQTSTL